MGNIERSRPDMSYATACWGPAIPYGPIVRTNPSYAAACWRMTIPYGPITRLNPSYAGACWHTTIPYGPITPPHLSYAAACCSGGHADVKPNDQCVNAPRLLIVQASRDVLPSE